MKKVEKGHFVRIHYTGRLENGEVFDSSEGRGPLEFQVGAGQVIRGFEEQIVGMGINEKKSFTLSPEEAYGHRDERLEQTFSRSELPSGFEPSVGEVLALQTPDGGRIPATVVSVTPEDITIDLNHPLAGHTISFEVEVVDILDQPPAPSFCGGY
ncbi:MAG: peptidylprolyl isomerase [Deltaproteobacteria bacterium]|nr:peptidylprolyl isomerase [Deltaproteobacteria bacterium]MBW2067431.1 peptidylprolyl isomerase [Deltaproteobacteria bacterium]